MPREKLTLEDWENRFTRDGQRLYFDDKEVQTELKLKPWQTALATVAAFFTILAAIGTCTNAYYAAKTYERNASQKPIPLDVHVACPLALPPDKGVKEIVPQPPQLHNGQKPQPGSKK